MRVIVTGATGFVGRHVVEALDARGHKVVAVARDAARASALGWPASVSFIATDVHTAPEAVIAAVPESDAVMHLAWPGLPNYRSMFHLGENLPRDFAFLTSLVAAGCRQLLVTGTCFEYGMQSGPLAEDLDTRPANPYAIAKDSLRRMLEALSVKQPFRLQWARLFYMYGAGQNPNSLLAQLDRAIDSGQSEFLMSGGEQLRDYLSVTEVARRLVCLLEHPDWDGVTNVCSGRPVSVRRLVEEHLAARGARLALRLGEFPYPDLEPLAFWGTTKRDLT